MMIGQPFLPLSQHRKLADAVRLQMERVLESEAFLKSPRLSQLFRFAVETSLDGNSDHLKEYTIAVDVFKRPESFDCRLDSIVRVEAARLRKKLETFYQTVGCDDPMILKLPPSGYEPVLALRQDHPHLHLASPVIGLVEGRGVSTTAWPTNMDTGLANFVRLSRGPVDEHNARLDLIVVLTGKSEIKSDYRWLFELAEQNSCGMLFAPEDRFETFMQLVRKAVRSLTHDSTPHLHSQSSNWPAIPRDSVA